MYRKAYYNLFKKVAHNRLVANDIDTRCIHTHLLTTILTGILMWAYAFTAFFTISSPIPGIVGFSMSGIHLLSPLLFLISNNVVVITLVMLLSGVVHQACFAFYTGGFESHILIWYGIIPMLGGLIAGIRTVIITSFIVMGISITYLILHLSGFQFPYLISSHGWFISQGLLVFGWIIVSTSVVAYFVFLNKRMEIDLLTQKSKQENLLQVLLHDISNQMQVIGVANKLLSSNDNQDKRTKMGLNGVSKGLINVNNVIYSVRDMYVYDKKNKEMELKPTSLLECINDSLSNLEKIIKEKEINIDINSKDYLIKVEPRIFTNQVLHNLISNSLKFSYKNQKIQFNTTVLEDKKILLSIKDYGIGIPQEILENLFDNQKTTSRIGTNSEKGIGLGMIIAQSMLYKMNSSIDVLSSTDSSSSWTQYNLEIPLS